MNKVMDMQTVQIAIPAALFVVLEGLSAVSAMAGDGVVIIQREVPVRPAYREGTPGRATSIDVSPDDKVQQMVHGSQSSLQSTELGDADIASVSTDTPHGAGVVTDATNINGLSNVQLDSHGLSGAGGTSSALQSILPAMTGSIGSAVGGATGHVSGGVAGALSGLTGAIMQSSGR